MQKTTANINVTPLIDILLVLLIIFMVISPMKSSDFKTKIPSEQKEVDSLPNPDTLVITINSNASLRLNKEENLGTIEEPTVLIARLRDIFSQREKNMNNERTVFIKAPKSMNYGDIIQVVDAVKMSGATPLSLQIDGLEK